MIDLRAKRPRRLYGPCARAGPSRQVLQIAEKLAQNGQGLTMAVSPRSKAGKPVNCSDRHWRCDRFTGVPSGSPVKYLTKLEKIVDETTVKPQARDAAFKPASPVGLHACSTSVRSGRLTRRTGKSLM